MSDELVISPFREIDFIEAALTETFDLETLDIVGDPTFTRDRALRLF